MNIRRYITALLLLFGCIISMSAATVPDVRSVVRQDGTVVESTDYYPYGTPFTTANSVQPYKYGTKELDRMHGLDLYDSEARWYDSLLGRTSTLDPKAEKYYSFSPYTWCAGNPVRFVDPDGEFIVSKEFESAFPITTKYLRNGIQNIFSNKKVIDALVKHSEVDIERLISDFEFGSGPTIKEANLNGAYADTKSIGTNSEISIDLDFLYNLEIPRTTLEQASALFFWEVIVLHEYCHRGDVLDGVQQNLEEGEEFEKEAYGKVLYLKDALEIIKQILIINEKGID